MERYLGESYWPRGKCTFVYYQRNNGRVGYFTIGRDAARDEGYSPDAVHAEAIRRLPS